MKFLVLIFFLLSSMRGYSSSLERRERTSGTVMAGYQMIASWVPFRWSASYSYIFNSQWTAELEWSRGYFGTGMYGIEFAGATENRYSLVARKFVGNSFHYIFGLFKNDFHAELASGWLDNTSTQIDDFRVKGSGLVVGVGNRWQWDSGFTLGVDWFRMNYPLFDKLVDNEVLDNIEDSDDAEMVKDAIDKVKNVPTFVLLGVNLGYSF